MSKLNDKVRSALEQDNTIVVYRSQLDTASAFSTEYMEKLGLSKSDLKKLEHKGLALRGYTKNVWVPGEKLPNGKTVEDNAKYLGKGHNPRWILVIEDEAKV